MYRKTRLNNDNIKGFIYLSYDEVKQNSLEPIEMRTNQKTTNFYYYYSMLVYIQKSKGLLSSLSRFHFFETLSKKNNIFFRLNISFMTFMPII